MPAAALGVAPRNVWLGQRIEQIIGSAEDLCHQAIQLDAACAEALVFLNAPFDVGALRAANVVAAPFSLLRHDEDGRGVQLALSALAVLLPTAGPAELEGGLEQWAPLSDEGLSPGEDSARSIEEPTP